MIAQVFLLAGLVGFAFAQTNSTSYHSTYSVDPGSVDIGTKTGWCTSQTNTCLQICGQETNSNNCIAQDLSWSCVCTNFMTPNISSFSGTIPAFECQRYIDNCQTYNTNNVNVQQGCLKIKCTTNNPANFVGVASSSSSSSSSAASSSSSSASSASAASSQSAAVAAASTSAASTSAATSTVTVASTSAGSAGTSSLIIGASASSGVAAASSTIAAATTGGAALAWPTMYGSGFLGAGAAVLAGMVL